MCNENVFYFERLNKLSWYLQFVKEILAKVLGVHNVMAISLIHKFLK